jgi:predicted DNA-binding transcriptional regulator AlpA
MSDTKSSRDNGDECFLSRKQICAITGLSYVTLWQKMRAGQFPAARKLSANRNLWLRSEVLSWMRDRPPQSYKPP